MVAGMQLHLLEQRAGRGLALCELLASGLGLAQPGGQLVAHPLERAEVEQPRCAGHALMGGTRPLGAAAHLKRADDRCG
jgi:hypothetical protein